MNFLFATVIFCENINDNKNKNNPKIKDKFYAPGGIQQKIESVKNYIKSESPTFYKFKKEILSNDKDLFQLKNLEEEFYEKVYFLVDDIKDIIVPTIISELRTKMIEKYIIKKLINDKELLKFQKSVLKEYRYKNENKNEYEIEKLIDYIIPLKEITIKIPYKILAKYFLYLYTIESDFYYDLNKFLTHDNHLEKYIQYIYVLFNSLGEKTFKSFKNENSSNSIKLYRVAKMGKKHMKTLKIYLKKKKRTKKRTKKRKM